MWYKHKSLVDAYLRTGPLHVVMHFNVFNHWSPKKSACKQAALTKKKKKLKSPRQYQLWFIPKTPLHTCTQEREGRDGRVPDVTKVFPAERPYRWTSTAVSLSLALVFGSGCLLCGGMKVKYSTGADLVSLYAAWCCGCTQACCLLWLLDHPSVNATPPVGGQTAPLL